MERTSHRRRYTRTPDNEIPKSKNIKEILLTQTIVSGIILATVMGMVLIKTDFTNNIRSTLKESIGKNTSIEELDTIFENITSKYADVKDSITGFFGLEEKGPTQETIDPDSQVPVEQIEHKTTTPENTEPNSKQPDRIDEDILRELNQTEVTPEKKILVPGLT